MHISFYLVHQFIGKIELVPRNYVSVKPKSYLILIIRSINYLAICVDLLYPQHLDLKHYHALVSFVFKKIFKSNKRRLCKADISKEYAAALNRFQTVKIVQNLPQTAIYSVREAGRISL